MSPLAKALEFTYRPDFPIRSGLFFVSCITHRTPQNLLPCHLGKTAKSLEIVFSHCLPGLDFNPGQIPAPLYNEVQLIAGTVPIKGQPGPTTMMIAILKQLCNHHVLKQASAQGIPTDLSFFLQAQEIDSQS